MVSSSMQSPKSRRPARWLRADEASLRERFNRLRIWERVLQGRYLKREHVTPISVPWDLDIVESVEAEISDHTTPGGPFFVALVHFYRRRDSSIGASGMPDPKMI